MNYKCVFLLLIVTAIQIPQDVLPNNNNEYTKIPVPAFSIDNYVEHLQYEMAPNATLVHRSSLSIQANPINNIDFGASTWDDCVMVLTSTSSVSSPIPKLISANYNTTSIEGYGLMGVFYFNITKDWTRAFKANLQSIEDAFLLDCFPYNAYAQNNLIVCPFIAYYPNYTSFIPTFFNAKVDGGVFQNISLTPYTSLSIMYIDSFELLNQSRAAAEIWYQPFNLNLFTYFDTHPIYSLLMHPSSLLLQDVYGSIQVSSKCVFIDLITESVLPLSTDDNYFVDIDASFINTFKMTSPLHLLAGISVKIQSSVPILPIKETYTKIESTWLSTIRLGSFILNITDPYLIWDRLQMYSLHSRYRFVDNAFYLSWYFEKNSRFSYGVDDLYEYFIPFDLPYLPLGFVNQIRNFSCTYTTNSTYASLDVRQTVVNTTIQCELRNDYNDTVYGIPITLFDRWNIKNTPLVTDAVLNKLKTMGYDTDSLFNQDTPRVFIITPENDFEASLTYPNVLTAPRTAYSKEVAQLIIDEWATLNKTFSDSVLYQKIDLYNRSASIFNPDHWIIPAHSSKNISIANLQNQSINAAVNVEYTTADGLLFTSTSNNLVISSDGNHLHAFQYMNTSMFQVGDMVNHGIELINTDNQSYSITLEFLSFAPLANVSLVQYNDIPGIMYYYKIVSGDYIFINGTIRYTTTIAANMSIKIEGSYRIPNAMEIPSVVIYYNETRLMTQSLHLNIFDSSSLRSQCRVATQLLNSTYPNIKENGDYTIRYTNIGATPIYHAAIDLNYPLSGLVFRNSSYIMSQHINNVQPNETQLFEVKYKRKTVDIYSNIIPVLRFAENNMIHLIFDGWHFYNAPAFNISFDIPTSVYQQEIFSITTQIQKYNNYTMLNLLIYPVGITNVHTINGSLYLAQDPMHNYSSVCYLQALDAPNIPLKITMSYMYIYKHQHIVWNDVLIVQTRTNVITPIIIGSILSFIGLCVYLYQRRRNV